MSKLNLCITLDKDYILAAIDLADGVYTTAEDAACFETALAKLTKDIGRTGNVEIISYEGMTAVMLPHYGIPDALTIDIGMEDFILSKPGFILDKVQETFKELDVPLDNEDFITGLHKLDAEIYRKSSIWAEKGEPEYPLQATNDRTITVDSNLKLKDEYTVAIIPEIKNVFKPDMPIMVGVPGVSDLVRAFKDTLTCDDFIYPENITHQTSEFYSPDEVEDMYRLSTSELYSDLGNIIRFNYFAEILSPSKELTSIVEAAIQSVYYKQNLKGLRANLGINNENLDYITGHSAVSETLNPNEYKLSMVLENLLISCLMYEYDFMSVGELPSQGEIRSVMFDEYMLGYIRRILKDNYAYTGKAYGGHMEEDEDGEDSDSSLDLYGYDRIQYINGSYMRVPITQEELLKRNEPIDLDGDQRVKEYLRDVISSKAYIEMFIYLLRFGETKNRYIKVSSKSEPKYPYFDTLLFKAISVPSIDASFEIERTPEGKSFILSGVINLDKYFEEYNTKLGVPIGVLLTQTLSNGATKKYKHYAIDAVSFYSTVTRLREDRRPYYDIDGIDFAEDGSVSINEDVLSHNLCKEYSAIQISTLLATESDINVYLSEAIPRIRKSINEVCIDAGLPSTSYSLFDAYKSVEDGTIAYRDIISRSSLSDYPSPDIYIAVKVAALQLPKLIDQSMGNGFASTSIIDLIKSVATATVVKTESGDKFTTLLQGNIVKYCKIINDAKEEIGYAFISKTEEGDFMLITSRREIGLRMPTVRTWNIMPFKGMPQAIFKQFNDAEDKKAFKESLIAKRYVFDSVKTFEYLQEDSK